MVFQDVTPHSLKERYKRFKEKLAAKINRGKEGFLCPEDGSSTLLSNIITSQKSVISVTC